MSSAWYTQNKAEKLQQHMNTVDPTGSIVFTREDEANNGMPLLDAKFIRKEDGSVNRKKTHTDQYMNFALHHHKQQKLGVVRTLVNRCETITTEERDNKEELDQPRDYRQLGKEQTLQESSGYPICGGSLGQSTKSNEEVQICDSPASPHHSQTLVGTSKRQGRVSRTR